MAKKAQKLRLVCDNGHKEDFTIAREDAVCGVHFRDLVCNNPKKHHTVHEETGYALGNKCPHCTPGSGFRLTQSRKSDRRCPKVMYVPHKDEDEDD